MCDGRDVRVSYVITTRNRAEFLDTALDNVREFITPEDELIVIDGASTDHTAQVVDKHRDIVTLYESECDYGEAHGLNKGILASRGRYIKPITDDDYIFPDAMRQAISVLERNPDLDAVLCGGESCRQDPQSGQPQLHRYLWLPPSSGQLDIHSVIRHVYCGVGLILTRRILSRVGLFDTTFRAVDTDYFSRLIACGAKFRYLNVKLFRHTVHAHSGVNNRVEVVKDSVRVLARHRQWGEVMAVLQYQPLVVKELFGSSTELGVDSMISVFLRANRLRRSRLRPFLALMVFGLERAASLVSWFKRKARRFASNGADLLGHSTPIAEPEWDGSLR